MLAERIDAPKNLLPTYGHALDGAHPHIQLNENGEMYYVIVERGEELRREIAVDMDDLLYYIFSGVTFQMATRFEVNNRVESEDCRRKLFAKQEELLGKLNDKWAIRQQKEHYRILRTHPFDDQASRRADYSKQLKENGMSAVDAWQEACKKYPTPNQAGNESRA